MGKRSTGRLEEMTTRRGFWIALGGSALLASTTGFAHLFGTGRLTPHMVADYGYLRWAHGKAPFQPAYLSAFTQDARFRQRFLGQPIDSLRTLFPGLHSGAEYDPTSYRAVNVQSLFPRYNRNRFEHYWLDGTQHQQQFGFCVLVVDRKIVDFFWVKG
jgi:hypothetical protein